MQIWAKTILFQNLNVYLTWCFVTIIWGILAPPVSLGLSNNRNIFMKMSIHDSITSIMVFSGCGQHFMVFDKKMSELWAFSWSWSTCRILANLRGGQKLQFWTWVKWAISNTIYNDPFLRQIQTKSPDLFSYALL